jgi:YD repeat-containing protein
MKTHLTAKALSLLCLLCYGLAFSQSADQPAIKAEMPQIVPPSPSVAGLMKFEEVPVDNYSGIPDISIPLYSIQSLAGGIGIDLSLKYHPLSITEKAGYTGLGWNLMAGGSISRTVRGLPDEIEIGGNEYEAKRGIYSDYNNYYNIISLLGTNTPNITETVSEYLWKAYERGTVDIQHDLYQFNFMGYSGRFYIKKNPSGTLEIVNLEDTRVKINFDYQQLQQPVNNKSYAFNGFTIYDENGNKYIFNIPEITNSGGSTANEYLVYNGQKEIVTSFQDGMEYISAFQLSEVRDINDQLVVQFIYNDDPLSENNNTSSVSFSQISNFNPSDFMNFLQSNGIPSDQLKRIDPVRTVSTNIVNIKARKVEHIKVMNKAHIYFTFEAGREDDNNSPNPFKLKHITIANWAEEELKKYTLNYDYSSLNIYGQADPTKKLLLVGMTESNFIDNKTLSYTLSYRHPSSGLNAVGKDYWNYYTLRPLNYTGPIYREPDPAFCTFDVLQKMTLPTGGSILFDFESNTYSYIGDEPLTDFESNANNWQTITTTLPAITSSGGSATYYLPVSGSERRMTYTHTVSPAATNYGLQLRKVPNGGSNYAELDPETSEYILEPNEQYYFRFDWFLNGTQGSATISTTTRTKIASAVSQNQYLHGGGIRIKTIGYFDTDAAQDYYDGGTYPGVSPAKEKHFNYSFFNNPSRSSGSLVFGKPTFSYTTTKTSLFELLSAQMLVILKIYKDLTYQKTTSYNNLMVQKTRGADVGYKNVTVYETGNGKSCFEYVSPIDEPEEGGAYTTTYPFMPSSNLDYRRGMLQNEKHYSVGNKLLSETIYDYDEEEIVDNGEYTGLHFFSYSPCPNLVKFGNFEQYYHYLEVCPQNPNAANLCDYLSCGYPVDYIAYYKSFEAYGWAKLTGKTTKEYFYRADNTQDVVETKELYDYNTANKKLSEYQKYTYTAGAADEIQRSEYTYYTDPNAATNNRISQLKKVKNYMGSTLVSTQDINFSGSFANNTAYLPSTISTSKGQDGQENRIQFLSYDAYSHPLEVKQVQGITVSYIYGYNKSVPIAMIENATYAQIATALGITTTALQEYNESNLTTINTLRSLLPAARVTTYTYIPLVGVSTVTDARGKTVTYAYDNFGRLKSVKDQNGKLLSENEYHYKTQQ